MNECLIPANPDASGLGVRVGIYLQSFLCVLNVFLHAVPDPGAHTALIIAVFVDAAKYHRLGIYHATIACYLCWMQLLSAVAPVRFAWALYDWLEDRIKDNDRGEDVQTLRINQRHVHNCILVWLGICWAAQIVLGAFGIWIYSKVASHPYDTSIDIPHCEASTVAWFMGKYYIIGVEGPWQRMWIAFYAILTIPVPLPFLILWLNGVVGGLILRLVLYVANQYNISIANPLPQMSRMWPNFGIGIALIYFCTMTELTVHANHIGIPDNPWGQGQVYPILMAGIPAYQLLQSLRKCFHLPRKSRTGGNSAGMQLGHITA